MKRKIALALLALSVLGLMLTSVKKVLYPEWTFNSPGAYNIFYSAYFSSVVLLIFSTAMLIVKRWFWGLGLVSIVFCGVLIFGQFHPIDTTTFPKDIETLKKENGQKIVLIEYTNCKTNHVYQDTVHVLDKWIFRKHLEEPKNNSQ